MGLLEFLLCPLLMFGTIMLSAFGMQRALDKQAEREVKRDYPKWYKEHWCKKQ